MRKITLINGKMSKQISVFNRLVQFGDGLFETIVFEDKKILFWSYHLKRLNIGCEKLNITAVAEKIWLADINRAISKTSLNTGVIKLMLSRGESTRGYAFNQTIKTMRLVTILPKPRKQKINQLTVSDYRFGYNKKLAGIKHCNRLEQVLASQNHKNDCLVLDQYDKVISTSKANIFIISDNELLTPDLSFCGIAGTRRQIILDIAKTYHIKHQIKTLSMADINSADAVFITNTIIGIAVIKRINNKTYQTQHPIIKQINNHFNALKQSLIKPLQIHRKRYWFYGLLAILFCFASYVAWVGSHKINTNTVVTIKKGDYFNHISEQLAPNNIASWHWQLFAKLLGYDKKMQSGHYQVNADMRIWHLLRNIASGAVILHQITLVEGNTLAQYYQQLKKHSGIVVTDDLKTTLEKAGLPTVAEGWLYPDSYQFKHLTNASEVFRKAYQNMQNIINTQWQKRNKNLPLQSPYQAIILASLIEKETAKNNEKSTIAGVFIKRLNKKMRLQTDPSVIYALGEKYQPPLTRQDLKIDSPYNTYQNVGLPPSAIGSSSLSSIQAALNPKVTDFLFFVAKADGSHHFSSNYQQHLKAIETYRKND